MSNSYIQYDNDYLYLTKKFGNVGRKEEIVVSADLRKLKFPDKTFFPDADYDTLTADNFRHNTVVVWPGCDYGRVGYYTLTVNTFIPTTVDTSCMFNEFYVQYVPLDGTILNLKFYLDSDDPEERCCINALTKYDVQRPITYHFYQISNDYKVDFDFDTIGRCYPLSSCLSSNAPLA